MYVYCMFPCVVVPCCLSLCVVLASMQRELDEGHVRFRDSGPQREVLTRAGDQQYFVKEVSS